MLVARYLYSASFSGKFAKVPQRFALLRSLGAAAELSLSTSLRR